MTYIEDAGDIWARYAFLDETSIKAPRIRLWLKRGPRPQTPGGCTQICQQRDTAKRDR